MWSFVCGDLGCNSRALIQDVILGVESEDGKRERGNVNCKGASEGAAVEGSGNYILL